jgi:hypothetical protein
MKAGLACNTKVNTLAVNADDTLYGPVQVLLFALFCHARAHTRPGGQYYSGSTLLPVRSGIAEPGVSNPVHLTLDQLMNHDNQPPRLLSAATA